MGAVTGVVFDVDDTLYLERDFVRSGFRHVARKVADSSEHDFKDLFDHLWGGFEAGTRGTAFDDLLADYPAGSVGVADLVEVYRSHQPDVALGAPARGLLVGCRRLGFRIGVLSDGPAGVQQRKVDALGLEEFADPVVLTGRWGVEFWKPHLRGYRFLEQAWGLEGEDLVYVADNPHKDFVTPRRRGWKTIRLRFEGQLHFDAEAPSAEFAAEMEADGPERVAELLGVEPVSLSE